MVRYFMKQQEQQLKKNVFLDPGNTAGSQVKRNSQFYRFAGSKINFYLIPMSHGTRFRKPQSSLCLLPELNISRVTVSRRQMLRACRGSFGSLIGPVSIRADIPAISLVHFSQPDNLIGQ